jgi:hypothetical protein
MTNVYRRGKAVAVWNDLHSRTEWILSDPLTFDTFSWESDNFRSEFFDLDSNVKPSEVIGFLSEVVEFV